MCECYMREGGIALIDSGWVGVSPEEGEFLDAIYAEVQAEDAARFEARRAARLDAGV